MALTSVTDSRSLRPDTPIPYRLDTSAILIARRPITDEQLAAIRRSIEPRDGFWQFEFKPWHYWAAIGAAAVLFVAFIAFAVTHGAVR